MTVKELIEELSVFDPDAEVRFCTGADDNLTMLSVYRADTPYRQKDAGIVWVDLGDEDDE